MEHPRPVASPLPGGDPQHSLSASLAKQLTEVGFLAISRRRLADARVIFHALRRFRPDQDFPVIGLALIALTEQALPQAIALLREQIPRVADDRHLQAFLALALLLVGRRTDSQQLLRQHAPRPADPALQAFWLTLGEHLQHATSPASVDWTRLSLPDWKEQTP